MPRGLLTSRPAASRWTPSAGRRSRRAPSGSCPPRPSGGSLARPGSWSVERRRATAANGVPRVSGSRGNRAPVPISEQNPLKGRVAVSPSARHFAERPAATSSNARKPDVRAGPKDHTDRRLYARVCHPLRRAKSTRRLATRPSPRSPGMRCAPRRTTSSRSGGGARRRRGETRSPTRCSRLGSWGRQDLSSELAALRIALRSGESGSGACGEELTRALEAPDEFIERTTGKPARLSDLAPGGS